MEERLCQNCKKMLTQHETEKISNFKRRVFCSQSCRSIFNHAHRTKIRGNHVDIIRHRETVEFKPRLIVDFETWRDFMQSMYLKDRTAEEFVVDKISVEAVNFRLSGYKLKGDVIP